MSEEPEFPVPTNHFFWEMTLRDYFAAKAMEVFLMKEECKTIDQITIICDGAYEIADAMLESREIA